MRRGSWLGRQSSAVRRPLAVLALLAVLGSVLLGAAPAHASEYWLDIDITNQVLSEVIDGQAVSAMHISTGSGEWYWQDGEWWLAETPRGWFEVYYKDPGWVEAPLGWLYNALYFHGGYAVHGSYSVPDYPASHGCVRVSLEEADWLFAHVPIGTPVFVHD